MKIWLRVHGFGHCSWTYVWDHLRYAFEKAGDDLAIFEDVPGDVEEYVEVWWGDPQYWQWSNEPVKARIAIALSEARSILAPGKSHVIANLNMADVIICPSASAQTAFLEAPIDKPIEKVFFGVDETGLSYKERKWSGTLSFLHAGVTQFRKGSWLVPEAFVSAFSADDDVELYIITAELPEMFMTLRNEYGDHPKIHFISERFESSADLYNGHHVYVSPHLSEGFGLMIPEAMATGMPCLVSRCSAPREFFSSEYGWWIEMSEIYAPVADCLPETNGVWRTPSLESLAEGMRLANGDRELAEAKGRTGSEYVLTELTWAKTVHGIKSIIKGVLNAKDKRGSNDQQRGKTVAGISGKRIAAC